MHFLLIINPQLCVEELYSLMADKLSGEERIQADIDRLKNPMPYQETFETQQVQELKQAIDILWRLQQATFKDASKVGYEKLQNAKFYLDKLLKRHFGDSEK